MLTMQNSITLIGLTSDLENTILQREHDKLFTDSFQQYDRQSYDNPGNGL